MKSNLRKKQQGFTLIEVTIAIAVTLVIVGAAVLAFRDAVQANQDVTFRSDMNDNLRAGMNIIKQDLIVAGTGIPANGIAFPYTPNGGGTCGTTTAPSRPSLANDYPRSGGGTFPQCNSFLPAISPGSAMGPLITSPDATTGNPGSANSYTDMITIVYADNNTKSGLFNRPVNSNSSPSCAGTIAADGSSLTFDTTSGCVPVGTAADQVQINPGDLIMFNNINGTALQTVTSIGSGGKILNFAANDSFNLNQRSDTTGTLKQMKTSTGCTGSNCYPPTSVTRIWMITYYLDNITDPNHVRLVRRVNWNQGSPVGETIENVQFTYNYVSGSLTSNNQPTIPTGYNENQVRAVSVFLAARSNYLNQRTKTYLRSNLKTQVGLRSLAVSQPVAPGS